MQDFLMDGLDDLVGSESTIYDKAFQQGFEEGSEEGKIDGWKVGVKTGTEIGFELGKYKGFAEAVQQSLTVRAPPSSLSSSSSFLASVPEGGDAKPAEKGDVASTNKQLKLCEKIINLVDEFNPENVTSVHDACSTVRSQYNLLKSSLGVADSSPQKESISGQKYSF